MGLDNEFAIEYARKTGYMVFDIETVPLANCHEYLTEEIEAPSNYKDPAKIADYIARARQKQVDDAGLDLDLCEIAAIGGAFHDCEWVQTRESTPEDEMLAGFWRFVSTIVTRGGSLVGFNCLDFDLPVLVRRSQYLGLVVPRVSTDRYRHEGVVDISEVLSFGRKEHRRSLSFYAKRFGVPHDDRVNGSQIAQLAADGKWSEVGAHCLDDIRTTKALAERIGLIHAPVQEPEAVPI